MYFSHKSIYHFHHDGIIVWALQYRINVKNMKSYFRYITLLGWNTEWVSGAHNSVQAQNSTKQYYTLVCAVQMYKGWLYWQHE